MTKPQRVELQVVNMIFATARKKNNPNPKFFCLFDVELLTYLLIKTELEIFVFKSEIGEKLTLKSFSIAQMFSFISSQSFSR
jgi:hypothetical protein